MLYTWSASEGANRKGQELTLTPPKLNYSIRPYSKGDFNFVFSSWSRNLWADLEYDGWTKPVFKNIVEKQIRRFVSDEYTKIFVAFEPTDEDFLYGWCAVTRIGAEQFYLYGYTKKRFRRQGIAKALTVCGLPEKFAEKKKILCWWWGRYFKRIKRSNRRLTNYWKER